MSTDTDHVMATSFLTKELLISDFLTTKIGKGAMGQHVKTVLLLGGPDGGKEKKVAAHSYSTITHVVNKPEQLGTRYYYSGEKLNGQEVWTPDKPKGLEKAGALWFMKFHEY